jgi:hypothetical protein
MSFFKKLFSSKSEENQGVEKVPERSPTACPYCLIELEQQPSRRKKCPTCGKLMIVRKGILITKEEADIQNVLKRLEQFGISKQQFTKHKQDLTVQSDKQASVNETVWRILNVLVVEKQSYFEKKQIYFEMARFSRMEGRDTKPYIVEVARMELLDIMESGLEKVQMNNVNDDQVCEACRSVQGKTFTISEALSDMPIPNLCQNNECRCRYVAQLDI